ncbi:hypothetical protein ABH941_001679 [Streptacidiphilus sp. EB103A]
MWSHLRPVHRPGPTFYTVVAALLVMAAVVCIRNANQIFGHESSTAVTGPVLVSGDGRSLSSPASWTGCEDQPNLVAEESSSTVTVRIHRVDHSVPDQACDDGQSQQLTVTLHQPLGARRLVDGVTGSTITPLRGQ